MLRTEPEEIPLSRLRRARAVRRAFIGLVALVVVAGAAGVLGVRTETVSAEGGGYELSVTYPKIARGGLAVTFEIEVVRPGGFDGPVTVAVDGAWLAMFDENGLDPDPASATADAERVIWELDPPDGDTLVASFDARVEPAVQWGRTGRVAVLTSPGGSPVVEVSFRTWVMP